MLVVSVNTFNSHNISLLLLVDVLSQHLTTMMYLSFLVVAAVSNSCTASLGFRSHGNSLILENGYVSVTFDGSTSSLSFGADFSGGGDYTSVLAQPYGLRVRYTSGSTVSASSFSGEPEWLVQTDKEMVLRIPNIIDASKSALVKETWTLSMSHGQRAIRLLVEGETLREAEDVAAVYHGLYTSSSSIYGLFDDRGMAQMMNKSNACLGSNQTMSRAYVLGNGVALDFLRKDLDATSPRQVVLSTNGRDGYQTGFEDIMIGSYPELSLDYATSWRECWPSSALIATSVTTGMTYAASLSFIPNNYDFPVYAVQEPAVQPQIPFNDLRTFLTGIYGSPAGCLQGYYENHQGTIAPTISHPDVGYSPDTNFFDPDNFISLSALIYSGDRFLLQEARRVLERTANTMCGLGSEQLVAYCAAARVTTARNTSAGTLRFGSSAGNLHGSGKSGSDRDGQLMHHFVDLIPTYESIAGSEQLGPNVFWTWSCLRYISETQDYEWAVQMFPFIDLSVKYLLTFFDESAGMISAPGPLWIDVLVRENYTSDSNAIMVPFLLLAADAYEVYGNLLHEENTEKMYRFAVELRKISSTIAVTMSSELWDSKSNDHFITQLDPSGDTRDFIDYDSNLLAVAFGAVALGTQGGVQEAAIRAKRILSRVDAGEYTHVRATWCSELPYSGDACDCYIVGGDVCGDSVVTLARIGWADAHARKVVGDINTFDSLLLSPLQEDLINDVWLYERYDDTAAQIRTAYYFEYPSLIAMMLREIRYGLQIGLKKVEVSPFMNLDIMEKEFVFAFGDTYLSYSTDMVQLRLPSPGSSTRTVAVDGLNANASYTLSGCDQDEATATTDAVGSIQFEWTFASRECTLSLARQQKN